MSLEFGSEGSKISFSLQIKSNWKPYMMMARRVCLILGGKHRAHASETIAPVISC
jgi:hypothetical protein